MRWHGSPGTWLTCESMVSRSNLTLRIKNKKGKWFQLGQSWCVMYAVQ